MATVLTYKRFPQLFPSGPAGWTSPHNDDMGKGCSCASCEDLELIWDDLTNHISRRGSLDGVSSALTGPQANVNMTRAVLPHPKQSEVAGVTSITFRDAEKGEERVTLALWAVNRD